MSILIGKETRKAYAGGKTEFWYLISRGISRGKKRLTFVYIDENGDEAGVRSVREL